MSAAILNLNPDAAQTFTGTTPAPMAASRSSDDSNSNDAGTITANDFLTLLVTEMKNQDPTSNQDPNQYINQLVQVNSLQQLISINEVLTNSLGSSSTSSDSDTAETEAAQSSGTSAERIALKDGADSGSLSGAGAVDSSPQAIRRTAGNLSVPSTSASASSIAHALDGSKRAAAAR
jgi:flagellar basal-body rod modification protein FlgD